MEGVKLKRTIECEENHPVKDLGVVWFTQKVSSYGKLNFLGSYVNFLGSAKSCLVALRK